MKPLHIVISVLSSLLLAGALQAHTIRIGVTPGSTADSIQVAAAEAKKQGLDVKVVEFTDWTTPNTALDSGDLDLNYFQHQAFLDNAIKDRGYKLGSVGTGVLSNIGLFSYKVKRIEDLKDGARVAIANDPVNQGRGLLLLEKAGLIKLPAGKGWRSSINDITANPRKLKFVEVEGPQLVRVIEDVDLSLGYPSHFVSAGKPQVASSGLLYSGVSDEYFAIRFVARQDRLNDARLKQFVKIYQESPAVREQLYKSNANDSKLYTLAWLGK